MTRDTMADLILTLRGMTNAGSADYTIAGSAYWTDTQLQGVLDRYRVELRDEPLTSYSVTIGGTASWKEYQSTQRYLETSDGGTARFIIKDSTGATVSANNYSVEYERGLITFTADTSGSALYLTGYSYDVYSAAADVWYQKAAHATESVDFSTDNHSVKRSHLASMAMKMAERYESMAEIDNNSASSTMERGDYR